MLFLGLFVVISVISWQEFLVIWRIIIGLRERGFSFLINISFLHFFFSLIEREEGKNNYDRLQSSS